MEGARSPIPVERLILRWGDYSIRKHMTGNIFYLSYGWIILPCHNPGMVIDYNTINGIWNSNAVFRVNLM